MPSPRIPIVRLLVIVWLAAMPLRAAAQETAVADDYVFGPGDLLNIAVWKNPEPYRLRQKNFYKTAETYFNGSVNRRWNRCNSRESP
jgi:protein involved in polysaccharide export with SLBB domain